MSGLRVTVLGCGPSQGVPAIGNNWGLCNPNNPRNRRRRPSITVERGEARLLVDTSPDLREQLLDVGIGTVDAVLYTHAHADHIMGIDDIRSLNRNVGKVIPAYGDAGTLKVLQNRMAYVFAPISGDFFYKPCLEAREIEAGNAFEAAGVEVVPFRQDHGFSETLGFRIGDFAYCPDVVDLDDIALELLEGVRCWIVDCFRYEPHPTHAHLDKVVRWRERLGGPETWLTHMSDQLDYDNLAARCPAGVAPAHDGLVIETS